MIPPIRSVAPPVPPTSSAPPSAPKAEPPPYPGMVQTGQQKVPADVQTEDIQKHDDPKTTPKSSGTKQFSKEFLATCGMLVSGKHILMPRQVLPFTSKGTLIEQDLKYVRWQVSMRPEKCEHESGISSILEPAPLFDDSIFASRRSHSVTVRPDGIAGFLGLRMEVDRQQMTLAEARAFSRHLTKASRTYPLVQNMQSFPSEDPTESMQSILPVFYRGLSYVELLLYRERLTLSGRTALRHVYDVATQEWKWLLQLGTKTPSPMVFSERGGPSAHEANWLNVMLQDLYLISDLYVGGCCLEDDLVPLDYMKAVDLNRNQIKSVETFAEKKRTVEEFLLKADDRYRLAAAVFSIPSEEAVRRKLKSKQESPMDYHDPLAMDIRRIINLPAENMASRVRG